MPLTPKKDVKEKLNVPPAGIGQSHYKEKMLSHRAEGKDNELQSLENPQLRIDAAQETKEDKITLKEIQMLKTALTVLILHGTPAGSTNAMDPLIEACLLDIQRLLKNYDRTNPEAKYTLYEDLNRLYTSAKSMATKLEQVYIIEFLQQAMPQTTTTRINVKEDSISSSKKEDFHQAYKNDNEEEEEEDYLAHSDSELDSENEEEEMDNKKYTPSYKP